MYLCHCVESQAKSTAATMQMNDIVKKKREKGWRRIVSKDERRK